jgi:hypothetical protein
VFVGTHGTPQGRFQRAIRGGHLYMAELALLDMDAVSLTNALALVRLYAQDGSPKYERAALKYLRRYMDEAAPSLEDVARTAVLLAEGKPD